MDRAEHSRRFRARSTDRSEVSDCSLIPQASEECNEPAYYGKGRIIAAAAVDTSVRDNETNSDQDRPVLQWMARETVMLRLMERFL
jgi:hypothetical protein